MLTRKQHELLMFIHERLKESGIPPSFDEMKEALDLASKSGIHRLITALEERGFIRRLPNRARALEVLRLPDSIAPGLNAAKKFSPSVIQGSLGRQVKQPSRTPAAIWPMTGMPREKLLVRLSLSLKPRRRLPSMTLGAKPRGDADDLRKLFCAPSGILTISSARARCGRRRMKPRSSRAVISR
jgi:hypothetical protein